MAWQWRRSALDQTRPAFRLPAGTQAGTSRQPVGQQEKRRGLPDCPFGTENFARGEARRPRAPLGQIQHHFPFKREVYVRQLAGWSAASRPALAPRTRLTAFPETVAEGMTIRNRHAQQQELPCVAVNTVAAQDRYWTSLDVARLISVQGRCSDFASSQGAVGQTILSVGALIRPPGYFPGRRSAALADGVPSSGRGRRRSGCSAPRAPRPAGSGR